MFKTVEENVTINSKVTLQGTLSLPEGKVKSPAVLLLHGSGPTDRDENVKGMAINAFKELAEAISPLGFAVLRYDKRGVGQSEGDFFKTGFWDLVDDAEAAVNFLKQHPRVDPNQILLLGHSEGCAIAPALNRRQPMQGLILVAGTPKSVKEVIIGQAEAAFEEIDTLKGFKGKLLRFLKVSEKGRKSQAKLIEKIMSSNEEVMRIQLQKVNAKWMREHFTYTAAEDLSEVNCPTLAITGSKDVQVLPEDAKRIAELVQGPSEYHILEDVNHLLRKQAEHVSMLELKKIYKNSVNQPMDTGLIHLIQSWLQRNFV